MEVSSNSCKLSFTYFFRRDLLDGTFEPNRTTSSQNFPVSNNFEEENHNTASQYVKLEILNNHGNDDYTCIYRFRVHGHRY
jgi:hypothetical protein